MKNLRTQSQKPVLYVLLFLAGISLGYSLVKEFVFEKPENGLLLITACCLLAGYSPTKNK
ncbi:MAG: hypothetical protein EAZ58_04385 [Flavobacterium sp.]|jgi:uncharacterized membrane protein YbjE (DUF340 family)|nr:MAG: hypothetical protein EAZ58_04385 [Flavobacterium sp.]